MAPDLMQSTTHKRRVKIWFGGQSSWINGSDDSLGGIEPRNVMRWSFQSRNRTVELEPLLNARSKRRAFIVHLVGGYWKRGELCLKFKGVDSLSFLVDHLIQCDINAFLDALLESDFDYGSRPDAKHNS